MSDATPSRGTHRGVDADADPGTDRNADPEQSHRFVAAMGLDLWAEGNTTYGQAPVVPGLCVPGTAQPRIAVLATMVDVVVGSRPEGPVNPTVDLHIELLRRVAPAKVRLSCELLKAGRTLLVGRALIYADDDPAPFSRSVITFMNRRMEQWNGGSGRAIIPDRTTRIEELVAPRFGSDGSVEVDTLPGLTNGVGGTVQGGVLALLAELTTERAASTHRYASRTGPPLVSQVDIHYLNRVRVGPVRAVADVLSPVGDRSLSDGPAAVEVRMTDVGDEDRLVAVASTVVRSF